MTEPEPPRFCGGIDWTTGDDPWRCDGIMQDGYRTVHQCAASYDHVEYEGEDHVCALGHRWPVWRPRRRWRDRLLRRPPERLRRRREPGLGSFWDDPGRNLENPKFRRSYIEESGRIQAADERVKAAGTDCDGGDAEMSPNPGNDSAGP